MIIIKKGHVFKGPNGQGYELTQDIEDTTEVSTHHFEPFGGAPVPVQGEPMPEFLLKQIQEIVAGKTN
jgi:hypothetical protein